MTRAAKTTVTALPALALIAAVTAADARSERCYADWSDAALVVRREALASAGDVHEIARRRRVGDLVRITLCEDNGRYTYRLLVREAAGRIVNITIDARRPFDGR